MKRGKAARAAWALTVCALIVAAALADSSPAADHEPAAEPVPEIQCDLCHETDAEFSHPVGVTPSMEVPAHLPLEEGYARQEEIGRRLRPTADAREAQRAFVEKRKPIFRGE